MNREYEEAFAEVDEVIKLMPIDLSSKIPLRFRQVISDCKAKDYKIEIKEPIEEQKLKNETIISVQSMESVEVSRMIREDCKRAGFIPNLREVASLDEEYLLVEMGMGIGICNQYSIACSNPNIKVLKDLQIGENNFALCWKKENPNPAVALFINYIRKQQ